MSYTANLWLYFLLLLGIIMIPGMDMLFVIGNSLTRGLGSGLSATSGIMLGGALHSLFGAILVIVLVQVPASYFNPLIICGSLYMAWIGYSLFKSTIHIDAGAPAGAASGWIAFRQGVITCLLNPKAWLFVIAVYPQFLKPSFGNIWLQAMVMGLLTVLTQAAVYGSIAIFAGNARRFLMRHPLTIIQTGRLIGLLFIAVAAVTLFEVLNGKG